MSDASMSPQDAYHLFGGKPEFGVWYSIEDAPRDGTEILGYRWCDKDEGDDYEFYNVVYWEKGIGWCLNDGNCIEYPVTHWTPLPASPNAEQEWD